MDFNKEMYQKEVRDKERAKAKVSYYVGIGDFAFVSKKKKKVMCFDQRHRAYSILSFPSICMLGEDG